VNNVADKHNFDEDSPGTGIALSLGCGSGSNFFFYGDSEPANLGHCPTDVKGPKLSLHGSRLSLYDSRLTPNDSVLSYHRFLLFSYGTGSSLLHIVSRWIYI
jgi:hypothetical protein